MSKLKKKKEQDSAANRLGRLTAERGQMMMKKCQESWRSRTGLGGLGMGWEIEEEIKQGRVIQDLHIRSSFLQIIKRLNKQTNKKLFNQLFNNSLSKLLLIGVVLQKAHSSLRKIKNPQCKHEPWTNECSYRSTSGSLGEGLAKTFSSRPALSSKTSCDDGDEFCSALSNTAAPGQPHVDVGYLKCQCDWGTEFSIVVNFK